MRSLVRSISPGLGTFGLGTLLLLIALQAHAEKKCQLVPYAELPVTMSGTRPLVRATINGIAASFVVDSGAFFNTLTDEAAKKYQIKLSPAPFGFYIQGASGNANVSLGNAKDFTLVGFLGGQVIHDVKFIVSDSFVENTGVAGLIGQNTIGHDDTEYDLANGIVRLIQSNNCGDQALAYWHGSANVGAVDIQGRTRESPHIVGTAKLNGKKIRVLFDTGAGSSILTLKAAERVGIKPEDDNVTSVGIGHGIGKKSIETSLARFDELDLGGELIKNARLQLGNISIPVSGGGADMLLGADFFLSHRVYVAAKQHRIYFTYNGGRVFDLGVGNQTKQASATPAADPSAAPTPEANDAHDAKMDAAAYRRRGAASAGRGDFESAIADFDQAIKLDPADAENFYQRALAKLQIRRPRLAMEDLDQVLKLKPDHIEALTERGMMRLANNREAAARVDFDAAVGFAPNDTALGLRIAELYSSTRHYDEAIDRFDRWIAAFPKDERLVTALYDRCWSRTMTGNNLESALADCNAALKKGSNNSQLLDGRGMVFLRRGEFDKSIADFKASLKLQPKNAMTLYGLGIAETKKGAKAEGDKNIQAATAITPTIGEFFKRLNLAP